MQPHMQVKVFRNAEVCLLPQTEIVVGDIVCPYCTFEILEIDGFRVKKVRAVLKKETEDDEASETEN